MTNNSKDRQTIADQDDIRSPYVNQIGASLHDLQQSHHQKKLLPTSIDVSTPKYAGILRNEKSAIISDYNSHDKDYSGGLGVQKQQISGKHSKLVSFSANKVNDSDVVNDHLEEPQDAEGVCHTGTQGEIGGGNNYLGSTLANEKSRQKFILNSQDHPAAVVMMKNAKIDQNGELANEASLITPLHETSLEQQDQLYMKNKIQKMRMSRRLQTYGLASQDNPILKEDQSQMIIEGEEHNEFNLLEFKNGDRNMIKQKIDLSGHYDIDNSQNEKSESLMQEKKGSSRKKIGRCMLRHDNKLKAFWDLYIIVFVLWNCISIPLQISFSELWWMKAVLYKIAEGVVDVSFALDIIVNFRTTYISPKSGLEITENNQIAKNYVQGGRFWVDLAASIPFDYIFTTFLPKGVLGDDAQRIQSLTGLLKLVRLLRLGRIVTFMKMRQDFKLGFRIFSLISLLLILIHWIGCVWYLFVIDTEQSMWLPPYNLNDQVTEFYDYSLENQYLSIFYYALIMMVGNELAPTRLSQYIFSSLIIIFGSLFMAFLFGSIAATLQSMSMKETQYADQLDLVQQNMKRVKLPEKKQQEFLEFLELVQESHTSSSKAKDKQNDSRKLIQVRIRDMGAFFKLLSPQLKLMTLKFINKDIFRLPQSPFKNAIEAEQRFIVANLELVIFSPEEKIVNQHDQGFFVNFIVDGEAEVVLERIVSLRQIKGVPGFENYTAAMFESAKSSRRNQVNPREDRNENNKEGSQMMILTPRRKNSKQFQTSAKKQKKTNMILDSQNSPEKDNYFMATSQMNMSNLSSVEKDDHSKAMKRGKHQSSHHAHHHGSDPERYQTIRLLQAGSFFGEIAAITGKKHSAMVRVCTREIDPNETDASAAKQPLLLTRMANQNFMKLEEQSPAIFLEFKKRMLEYDDRDLRLAQQYVKNVPYFRDLPASTIREIAMRINVTIYSQDSLIVKRGDVLNSIYIVKEGIVEVEVPYNNETIHFDLLPPGSCFGVFAPFGLEVQQILNFKAKTNCVIGMIDVQKDLQKISKKEPQLFMILKKFKMEQDNDMLTPFDFFRFSPTLQNSYGQQSKNERRNRHIRQVKKRVLNSLLRFCKDYILGRVEMPRALLAIRFLEEHREVQRASKGIIEAQVEEIKSRIERTTGGMPLQMENQADSGLVGPLTSEQPPSFNSKQALLIAEMTQAVQQRQQFQSLVQDGLANTAKIDPGVGLPDLDELAEAYRSNRAQNDPFLDNAYKSMATSKANSHKVSAVTSPKNTTTNTLTNKNAIVMGEPSTKGKPQQQSSPVQQKSAQIKNSIIASPKQDKANLIHKSQKGQTLSQKTRNQTQLSSNQTNQSAKGPKEYNSKTESKMSSNIEEFRVQKTHRDNLLQAIHAQTAQLDALKDLIEAQNRSLSDLKKSYSSQSMRKWIRAFKISQELHNDTASLQQNTKQESNSRNESGSVKKRPRSNSLSAVSSHLYSRQMSELGQSKKNENASGNDYLEKSEIGGSKNVKDQLLKNQLQKLKAQENSNLDPKKQKSTTNQDKNLLGKQALFNEMEVDGLDSHIDKDLQNVNLINAQRLSSLSMEEDSRSSSYIDSNGNQERLPHLIPNRQFSPETQEIQQNSQLRQRQSGNHLQMQQNIGSTQQNQPQMIVQGNSGTSNSQHNSQNLQQSGLLRTLNREIKEPEPESELSA